MRLNVSTNQEAFDKVVHHLATMPRQSSKPDFSDDTGGMTCMYRTSDGNRCAIGALIPDDDYSPLFENKSVGSIGIMWGGLNEDMLSDLQSAHDLNCNWNVERTKFTGSDYLIEVGTRYGVDVSSVFKEFQEY